MCLTLQFPCASVDLVVAFLFNLMSASRGQKKGGGGEIGESASLNKFVALRITRQNRPGDGSSIRDAADMGGGGGGMWKR
jgi:hypothetical protein